MEQRAGDTPTHNLCLRTDHVGDEIDGGNQCFCFVAEPAVSTRLLLG